MLSYNNVKLVTLNTQKWISYLQCGARGSCHYVGVLLRKSPLEQTLAGNFACASPREHLQNWSSRSDSLSLSWRCRSWTCILHSRKQPPAFVTRKIPSSKNVLDPTYSSLLPYHVCVPDCRSSAAIAGESRLQREHSAVLFLIPGTDPMHIFGNMSCMYSTVAEHTWTPALQWIYRRECFRNMFLCKSNKNPDSCLSWHLVNAGRRVWVNHCGRRSLLWLTSFWQLPCPFCITRDTNLIVWWTPLGMSVQSTLQDGWLALWTVCTLWDMEAGHPWRMLVIIISVSVEWCTSMVFVVLDIPPGNQICLIE